MSIIAVIIILIVKLLYRGPEILQIPLQFHLLVPSFVTKYSFITHIDWNLFIFRQYIQNNHYYHDYNQNNLHITGQIIASRPRKTSIFILNSPTIPSFMTKNTHLLSISTEIHLYFVITSKIIIITTIIINIIITIVKLLHWDPNTSNFTSI